MPKTAATRSAFYISQKATFGGRAVFGPSHESYLRLMFFLGRHPYYIDEYEEDDDYGVDDRVQTAREARRSRPNPYDPDES